MLYPPVSYSNSWRCFFYYEILLLEFPLRGFVWRTLPPIGVYQLHLLKSFLEPHLSQPRLMPSPLAWCTSVSLCFSSLSFGDPSAPLLSQIPTSCLPFLGYSPVLVEHQMEHQDTKTTFLAPSEMVHGRLIFRDLTCVKMSHIWLIIWLGIEVYVGDGFPSNFFLFSFFWLCQVLAATREVFIAAWGSFSCNMRSLSCHMWDLVLWPELEPRPSVLAAQCFNHWTTKEVASFQFLKALFPYNILWVFFFIYQKFFFFTDLSQGLSLAKRSYHVQLSAT